jgi:amino acid transporter
MVLLIFVALVGISAVRGAPANFHPAFHATPWLSILLTLQIVPYFMTGFESVPKYAEESNPDFRQASYMQAIGLALAVGALFYALSIVAVSYIAPWQSLLGKRFATAIAFEHGLGRHWPVQLILVMALFGLFQCFNGNFAASTRLLFAYARRGTVAPRFAAIHAKFSTPSVAVMGVTMGTLLALLLGDAILVPVTEVGSMASALGWLAACLSFWLVESRLGMRAITSVGICVSLLFVVMKLIPAFPGHFTHGEWIALAVWLLLGAVLRRSQKPDSASI